ncbi:dephospho-CoA kinase [Pseudonocardia sp. KRD-184]|uniref:Dephospho-CoA kinase n=1 Tax=Pseudonocardia oceani TaxID=2792013 RepID=A0ABS6UH16_9PSEU|nr:dephospho-CoA kinase [Pseudonocardia oceani]MBW0093065.1 dephospho-CoA kinase [Pseudonocardia oceani]MBW0099882.1 dephospho-CoA kinase [Pseudonocardia oceani]MBW0113542.1 dephospho-CoA kinase [Pseudonocardia oceani]MBW0120116.1 dephospho-CoA kinase [Pseudonocardia oceani]MBW0131536.1 dephospho-CoA kinase [Pseudonocardia oceani]
MLRVGLTGGIGSGKSTVARRLVARGAVLVDSDVLAREVVAAGTDGLAEIVAAFGEDVLGPDGGLDRPALASVVFGDADARARLNAIVHPRVRAASDALIAAAPADAVVVQDVPLLVEGGMAPHFPLVVVVHTEAEERVRRLVEQRGMPEADARSRIAAQVDDDARRAAADVWLDNSGAPDALVAVVDALWDERLVPFESNLRRGEAVRTTEAVLVDPDPDWPAHAARLAARVSAAAGGREVAHTGSTAVPGLPADDVIDLQLAVRSLDEVAGFRAALEAVGFPWRPEIDHDDPEPPGPVRPKLCHGTADPGRRAHLHIREIGSPGWRYALLFRDWLCVDRGAREEYLAVKRRAVAESGGDPLRYGDLKEPWFDGAADRAEAWAVSSGWVPSLA